MASKHVFMAWAILAGAGIPILASTNRSLSDALGNAPSAAAIIVFILAALATVPVVVMSGDLNALAKIDRIALWLLMGGVCLAFYMISIPLLVSNLELSGAIFLVLLGQLLMTALLEQYGWLNTLVRQIDLSRLAGFVFIIVGFKLTQTGSG